jgi:hypothetical protein
MKELEKQVAERGLSDVEVRSYICFGACQDGPKLTSKMQKKGLKFSF